MDEYDPDDWRDDREPDPPSCGRCNDQRVIRPGRLARLAGMTGQRCPSCDPNRYQRLRAWLYWRWHTRTLWEPRRSPDEAPF